MEHRLAGATNPTAFGAGQRLTAAGLVGAQALALAAVLLPARRGTLIRRGARVRRVVAGALLLGGAGLAVAGAAALGPALTPSPLPTRADRVRTTGPYRLVRHPAYAGLIAAALGRALGTGATRHAAAALTLTGVFWLKARYEERWLVARFPEYRAYRTRTPRLLPGARPARETDAPPPRGRWGACALSEMDGVQRVAEEQ